jgi:hypothetical protein
MISIQVIPRSGLDAYKLLRDKVTHDAQTWSWRNKAKTRLVHKNAPSGYIEVASADTVLTAQIYPQDGNPYFFVEKLIGRLVAWFPEDLFAINIQFIPDLTRRRR